MPRPSLSHGLQLSEHLLVTSKVCYLILNAGNSNLQVYFQMFGRLDSPEIVLKFFSGPYLFSTQYFG